MDRVLLRTDFSLQCSKPNAEIDLMAVRTILLVRSAYGCWTGSSDGWMRVGYTVLRQAIPIEFIVATYEENLHYCNPRAINNSIRSGWMYWKRQWIDGWWATTATQPHPSHSTATNTSRTYMYMFFLSFSSFLWQHLLWPPTLLCIHETQNVPKLFK